MQRLAAIQQVLMAQRAADHHLPKVISGTSMIAICQRGNIFSLPPFIALARYATTSGTSLILLSPFILVNHGKSG